MTVAAQDPVGAQEPWSATPVGDEVPDAGLGHQAVGVDGVRPRRRRAAVAVAQTQPAVGEDRGVQLVDVHGGVGGPGHPAVGVDEDAPAGEFRGRAVRGGQRGHHLAQRRAEGVVETEGGVRALGGQHEQRAGLVGGQARHVGAESRQQSDSAVPAAFGVDRDTGRREGLDVAVDGAGGDLQPLGELRGGDRAAGLEEQQERQEAVGLHACIYI